MKSNDDAREFVTLLARIRDKYHMLQKRAAQVCDSTVPAPKVPVPECAVLLSLGAVLILN